MSADRSDADARKRARAQWPIAWYRLGDSPSDDLSEQTSPEQRVAMMADLAESAWKMAGRELPTYDRKSIPGRLFRPGERRPDDET